MGGLPRDEERKRGLAKFEIKVFLMRLCGLIFSMMFLSAGIVLFLKCRLGSDPQTVLYDGISVFFHISYSMAAGIYSWSAFILAFLFARKYFGIGSVLYTFSFSIFIGLNDRLLSYVDFPSISLWSRCLLVLGGELLLCAGLALSIWANFGMNCTLAILYKICDRTGINFKLLKTGNDVFFGAAGFLMGGLLGVGTVFSALVTGVMIYSFKKILDGHFPILLERHGKKLEK